MRGLPEVTAAVAALLQPHMGLGVLPVIRAACPASRSPRWAYTGGRVGHGARAGRGRGSPMRIRSICCTGTCSPSARRHAIGPCGIRCAGDRAACMWCCGPRFLLVTFDAEAAEVAGVNTRACGLMCLNLSIGVAAAAAVHEVGVAPDVRPADTAAHGVRCWSRGASARHFSSPRRLASWRRAPPGGRVLHRLAARTGRRRVARTHRSRRRDHQPLAGLSLPIERRIFRRRQRRHAKDASDRLSS